MEGVSLPRSRVRSPSGPLVYFNWPGGSEVERGISALLETDSNEMFKGKYLIKKNIKHLEERRKGVE